MIEQLSANQRSAIQRAKDRPELQRLLFSKAKGVKWLGAFSEAGFWNPTEIPRPVPDEEEGYWTIPNWPITNYLVSIGPELALPENADAAKTVLGFVRAATLYARENEISNYRVWWHFSKTIRYIPPSLLAIDDLQLIDYWLNDPYQRGIVAEVLGKAWLPVLLADSAENQSKDIALGLLDLLYFVEVSEEDGDSPGRKKARFRYEAWNVRSISKETNVAVGQSLGGQAASLFRAKLENVLGRLGNDKWSTIWRPAIEDHEQNRTADDVESLLVEVFRDVVGAWIEADSSESEHFVFDLLKSQYNIFRRIAIHSINSTFPLLGHLSESLVDRTLFDSHHRHEMWRFLHNHYSHLPSEQRSKVSELIDSLKVTEDGSLLESATAYRQATWWAAIKDQDDAAEEKYRACIEVIGAEPEHPEFSSYMSVGWIGHVSPLSVEELLAFETAELIDYLNSYESPERGWPGEPNLEGLWQEFRDALKAEPLRYINHLKSFSNLNLPFKYSVLGAYDDLWKENETFPWGDMLPAILDFVEETICQRDFWIEQKTDDFFVPNRHWFVGGIAGFIERGFQSDSRSFPTANFDQSERIVRRVLEEQEGESFELTDDAVHVAINSPKGKCIEALITLALKACRDEHAENNSHQEAWERFEGLFNNELESYHRNEYEFATIAANRILQLWYMSPEWVSHHFDELFNHDCYKSWLCAMQGYSYVRKVYEPIYSRLADNGHLLKALNDETLNERVSHSIVAQIIVAFLSDFEALANPESLISQLLNRFDHEEMSQAIWFMWAQRKDQTERHKNKIFELWPLILPKLDLATKNGRRLASKLCTWAAFIDEVNDENKCLILSIAEYSDADHNSPELMKHLSRISERQPEEAYEIWKVMLRGSYPTFPEEDLKTVIANLCSSGDSGSRKANEIASLYTEAGIDLPREILKGM